MATTSRTLSRNLFSPLPDGESRLRSFGAGFGLEVLAVVLLVGIPLLMPQKLEVARRYWITPIEAPPVVPWKPQPPPKVVKMAAAKPPPVVAKEIPPAPIVPPKPKIMSPVFTSPVAKPKTAKRDTPNPDALGMKDIFVEKKPLSLGSSAIPTLTKPREAVQTGGFGDPNGVPPNPNSHGSPNIATLGSYDLPPGPGYGNGTGGAKGAKGVVASAGFGNGIAAGSPNGGGRGGAVQTGAFSDQNTAAAAPKPKAAATATPHTEPVEITFKPRPAYTDQARQAKIEGDVLLQVVFTASGKVQIVRVVRGLGYGLNETAQAAARQIQFKPARQDGQPVDFNGIVHITFELAY
ncbi:MAG: energy transducer TonB [Candidatus Acidiferrales bacterium]